MKLSEIKDICSENIEICSDCEFEKLYLVGKEFDEHAKSISFISDAKYIDNFFRYDIEGVICIAEIAEIIKNNYKGGIAVSQNPKTAFFEIHNYLGDMNVKYDDSYIDSTAIVHESAIIEPKGVHIGKNVVIYPHAVVKEGSYIGDNSIIRENCVIGGPAFYYFGENDKRTLVRSTGTVKIGKNVELHSNVVIEKGVMYGETLIEDNCKIDNGAVVGHDVKMGRNCTIAGNSDIAGGVHIGENVFFGVLAAVAPNVVIGKNAKLSSGAVVTKDVKEGEHVSGNFAIPHAQYINHIKDIIKK